MRLWPRLLLWLLLPCSAQEPCELPRECIDALVGSLAFFAQKEAGMPCEEKWQKSVVFNAGPESNTNACSASFGVGKDAWLSNQYRACYTQVVRSGLMASKPVCFPHAPSTTTTTKVVPVCQKMPALPVWGSVTQRHVQVEVEGNERILDAWDFKIEGDYCRMGLRSESMITSCLEASWVVLLGASQSAVWAIHLANTLAPGAFDSVKDGYISDGVFLQMLDVVIEDGIVLYKHVTYSSNPHDPGKHTNVHTSAADREVLPRTYKELENAPWFTGRRIRITNLLAEWWDEVDLGINAVKAAPSGWQQAEVFTVVAVGLWYAYAGGCNPDQHWCDTRPDISGKSMDEVETMYLQGMTSTLTKMDDFCSGGGRVAWHGCTVLSIEYCAEFVAHNTYAQIYHSLKDHIRPFVKDYLRFLDLWTLTMQMPEDCLWGHVTPASAGFTWQILLSSVCPVEDVSAGTLAAFSGELCRSSQILPKCPGEECGGYTYTWDYALSKPCEIIPVVDLNHDNANHWQLYSHTRINLVSPWELAVDRTTRTFTTTVSVTTVSTTTLSTTSVTVTSITITATTITTTITSTTALGPTATQTSISSTTGSTTTVTYTTLTSTTVTTHTITHWVSTFTATSTMTTTSVTQTRAEQPFVVWAYGAEEEVISSSGSRWSPDFNFPGSDWVWSILLLLLAVFTALKSDVLAKTLKVQEAVERIFGISLEPISLEPGKGGGTGANGYSSLPQSKVRQSVVEKLPDRPGREAYPNEGYDETMATDVSVASSSSDRPLISPESLDNAKDGTETLGVYIIEEDENEAEALLALPKSCMDFQKPKDEGKGGDRFSFGLARSLASCHVVIGHLNARHETPEVYAFSWGFTWVPWFFLLSGFILCSAELRKPRRESVLDYVCRRLVTIYPVYALGLLIACLSASTKGTAPAPWVLLCQAWLVQAWYPGVTEWSLQMQCWFLSCLVVFWAVFPAVVTQVAKMSLRQVIAGMLMAMLLPWLFLLLPDLYFGNLTWYQEHSWGHMRNLEDFLVVTLKFHPICYAHVFILGMLLSRLRLILPEELKDSSDAVSGCIRVVIEMLAPCGYAGLLFVFLSPSMRPPFAKLAARLFYLLPLHIAILLGLAGLPGMPQPAFAKLVAPLNFLESYSYCVYVAQFICMNWWSDKDASLPFFLFLGACAIFTQILVQKPAEKIWRIAPVKASIIAPSVMSVLLLLIYLLGGVLQQKEETTVVEEHLPESLRPREGMLDVRLPLVLDSKDSAATGGGDVINPSVSFLPDGNRLVVAARLHRRSTNLTMGEYKGKKVHLLEEYWHSSILLASVDLPEVDWTEFVTNGSMPGGHISLRPWKGLHNWDHLEWSYPNLCTRDTWLESNNTLVRLIVTGPEDPKPFLGPSRNAYSWGQAELDVAFNSYPPDKAAGTCKDKTHLQMYWARGVDVNQPSQYAFGAWLNCGHLERAEKNWIPFQKDGFQYFVYSMLPHVVLELNADGSCGRRFNSVFAPLAHLQAQMLNAAFRGSAQAVFIDDKEATPTLPIPHFLALLHITDMKGHRYAHYAYRFRAEPPFQMIQVSSQLPLQTLSPYGSKTSFAFASGLVVRDRQVVITYAAGDRDSRALIIPLERLDQLFVRELGRQPLDGDIDFAEESHYRSFDQ